MNLLRFKTYETVYLFNTDYESYAFSSSEDGKFGTFQVKLWDGRPADFLVQSIGKPEESVFRFHHTYGSPLNDDEFLQAFKDFLYIFNKNRLGITAKLETVKFDPPLNPYGLFSVKPQTDVYGLERTLASTKLVNSKVKKDVPVDKLVYQAAKGEGKEYEWSKIKIDIEKFLEDWAKHDNTDLHSVLAGKKMLPDWSAAQYRKGRKDEGMHDFYRIIEKLRQFQKRYE